MGAVCYLFQRHACEALTPLPRLFRWFCRPPYVDTRKNSMTDVPVPCVDSWSFVKPVL